MPIAPWTATRSPAARRAVYKFASSLVALVLLLFGVGAASAEVPVDRAAQTIVDTLIASWNAGNGAAYSAPFTEDATFRVWNGLLSRGRAAIAEDHQRIFDTFYAGTELQLEIVDTKQLTRDVALVYLEGSVSRGGQELEPMPGMQGAFPFMVLQQLEGSWQVVHFQNTPNFVPER